jgi:hypothetical protein
MGKTRRLYGLRVFLFSKKYALIRRTAPIQRIPVAPLPAELFDELQHDADTASLDPAKSSSWNRPILNRLRDYVSLVLSPLNMRIRGVSLYTVATDRIVVKISGTQHIALVFAPHDQLAAEVFVRRVAAQKHIPFPAVIKSDVSYNSIPVGYMLSAFVGGTSLETVEDDTLQRVGARQVGRSIRVLHGAEAPGYGAPTADGTWKGNTWPEAVRHWVTAAGYAEALADAIGPHIAKRFWERWLATVPERAGTAAVLHGDVDPRRASVSVSSHIQLEGIDGAGLLVGGDPMYDVAASMRSRFHPEFRQGFMEGYTASGPLNADEIARAKHYLLAFRVIDAMHAPTLDRDAFASSVSHVLTTLGE